MPLRAAITITFCQLLLTDAREVIVVQLKLLGLTIPEESGIVRMDAMMRADLIDLMARILMEVFQAEGGYALEQTHDDNYGCFAAQAAGVMFAMRWMDAFARPGRMSAR